MNERAIFEHLFSIADQSHDTDGVVTSCLVRQGTILLDAVSAGTEHAEYVLLQKMQKQNITVEPDDIVYVTLQPCCERTPGGLGEKLGDCTTNLINARIRHVIYAAKYPKGVQTSRRFHEAKVDLKQTSEHYIVVKAVDLFNSTCSDPSDKIPQQ